MVKHGRHFFEKEGTTMMRINLLDPVKRDIYGTATPKEILEVCLVAVLFCVVMGLIAVGVAYLLLTFKE